jgi:MoaA/NifB/PqqE/SkfB family radical SAM enzyme
MIYSLTSERLKEIARLKAIEDARLKKKADEIEESNIKQQAIINQSINDENERRENERRENERRRRRRDKEGCDYVGEDFSNQYNNNRPQTYLLIDTPSYILAMYQKFINILENSIGKLKKILYILFHESPTLYRITH